MIIIKDLEIYDCGNREDIYHFIMDNPIKFNSSYSVSDNMLDTVEEFIHQEHVSGRHFRTENGKEICLGWTKKVEDILGLPMEAFENQERMIKELQFDVSVSHDSIFKLRRKLDAYEKMSFINRLKFLFKRKICKS